MPDLTIKKKGGPISSRVRILKQHVGVAAIDLWDDTDHNGRPDQYLKRVKKPNEKENQFVDIGSPGALDEKVVQWIWMPSQPAQSTEGWEVEIDVRQGGKSLDDMPLRLAGDYPAGKRFDIQETWYRLVIG